MIRLFNTRLFNIMMLVMLVVTAGIDAAGTIVVPYFQYCPQSSIGVIPSSRLEDQDPDQLLSMYWQKCVESGEIGNTTVACNESCAERQGSAIPISGKGSDGLDLSSVCQLMCTTREFVTKQCADNDTACTHPTDWTNISKTAVRKTGDLKRKQKKDPSGPQFVTDTQNLYKRDVLSDKTYFIPDVSQTACASTNMSEWRWVRSVELTDIFQRLVDKNILTAEFVPRKVVGQVSGDAKIVLTDPKCPGIDGPCDRFFDRGDIGCCCANKPQLAL